MSDFFDDADDMTPLSPDTFDDAQAEALLTGAAEDENPRLAQLLLQARSIAHAPAPEPSAALAALLAGPATAPQVIVHPRWRRRLATVAVVSVGSSAALVGAAAANVLPQHAQQVVARVVNDVSPLTLPGVHPGLHPAHLPRTGTSPTSHRPPDIARPAASAPTTAAPTGAATPTPGPAKPEVTPTPTPRRTDDGRPTALPTQAHGRGDDHARPTAGEGHGRGKAGSAGPDKGSQPTSPKVTKPSAGSADGGHTGGSGKGDSKKSVKAGASGSKSKHRVPGRA